MEASNFHLEDLIDISNVNQLNHPAHFFNFLTDRLIRKVVIWTLFLSSFDSLFFFLLTIYSRHSAEIGGV